MLEYLRTALIVKPQGIKGEIKLQPLTNDITRFKGMKSAFIEGRNGGYEPSVIASVRVHEGAVYVKLAGVDDRNAAELLRGRYICVDRAHAVKLPEYTYFVDELIGLEVYDTSGKKLGTLTDVIQTGNVDVYDIRGEQRIMVPALKRAIESVDMDQARMVLRAEVLEEVALFET
jgi:16S rRNA processing protein RimM